MKCWVGWDLWANLKLQVSSSFACDGSGSEELARAKTTVGAQESEVIGWGEETRQLSLGTHADLRIRGLSQKTN